ncbi:MAG: hypothetical protein RR716_05335 [Christensenellaceae bacterium]
MTKKKTLWSTLSEEQVALAEKLYAEAKSNIEAPLICQVLTPVCQSCTHVDMKYGTWDEPVCDVYEPIPKEFIKCRSIDCPHYEKIPGIGKGYLPVIEP